MTLTGVRLPWLPAFTLIQKNNRYTCSFLRQLANVSLLELELEMKKRRKKHFSCTQRLIDQSWSMIGQSWSRWEAKGTNSMLNHLSDIIFYLLSISEMFQGGRPSSVIDKHFNNWSLSLLSCFAADLKKEIKKPLIFMKSQSRVWF